MLTLTKIKINDSIHEVVGEEISYNEVVLLAGYSGRPNVVRSPDKPVEVGEKIPLDKELTFTVSYT